MAEEVLDERLLDLVHNISTMRRDFFRKFVDPRRDIDDECGFPKVIDPQMYQDMYDREALAIPVVEAWPKECWQVTPRIYSLESESEEDEFELAIKTLGNGLRGEQTWYEEQEGSAFMEYLARFDVRMGIGSYGVLLFGFDDGLRLSDPVAGIVEENSMPVGERPPAKKPGEYSVNVEHPEYKLIVNEQQMKLLYMRVFSEVEAQITKFETNRTSPRYGQPTEYFLTFNESDEVRSNASGVSMRGEHVHWTRVIHGVDGLQGSEVFGYSRQKQVFNDLLSERKLSGGSPEGYWKMCFTSLVFESLPQLGANPKIDKTRLKNAIEDFQNSLQKVLILTGMSAKSIAPTVVDPTPHHNMLVERICIKMRMPVPVFKGYEIGEQASENNSKAWDRRVRNRQVSVCIPRIVVPVIDRLIMVGCLPEPSGGSYCVDWPDMTAMTAQEKANLAVTRMTAVGTYVDKGKDMMTPEDFYVKELGYTIEEAEEILEAVADMQEAADDAQALLAEEEVPEEEVPEEEVPEEEVPEEEVPEEEVPEEEVNA